MKYLSIGPISSILINSVTSKAVAATVPSDCSESITVLKKGSSTVTLIGTAHISDESALLVERVIRMLKPNVIMIELDAKRIGKFANVSELKTAGFDIPRFAVNEASAVAAADSLEAPSSTPERSSNLFESVLKSVKSSIEITLQGLSGALLGKFLSQFYKSFEKLGFTAGGEFIVAVKLAKELGARVLLGDRDVDTTLQHLAAAIEAYPSDRYV